jgi:hypothetical protein
VREAVVELHGLPGGAAPAAAEVDVLHIEKEAGTHAADVEICLPVHEPARAVGPRPAAVVKVGQSRHPSPERAAAVGLEHVEGDLEA